MKRFLVLSLLILVQCLALAAPEIRFSESVTPYRGGLLISNYGTDTLRGEEKINKGFILFYKNNRLKNFIPADGNLKKPTATVIHKRNLYVCDRDKIWIYNLRNLKQTPQKIAFPKEDTVINAMDISKDELYVTVTNTDRVYKINLKEKELKPEKWIDIPSPNGIVIKGKTVYIASIPKDYSNIKEDNVIYVIQDKVNPSVEKFSTTPGIYDGLAISGRTLYVSDWSRQAVIAIDTKTKKEEIIFQESGIGPANIAVKGRHLYIPDLLNHRIIVLDLKKYSISVIGKN